MVCETKMNDKSTGFPKLFQNILSLVPINLKTPQKRSDNINELREQFRGAMRRLDVLKQNEIDLKERLAISNRKLTTMYKIYQKEDKFLRTYSFTHTVKKIQKELKELRKECENHIQLEEECTQTEDYLSSISNEGHEIEMDAHNLYEKVVSHNAKLVRDCSDKHEYNLKLLAERKTTNEINRMLLEENQLLIKKLKIKEHQVEALENTIQNLKANSGLKDNTRILEIEIIKANILLAEKTILYHEQLKKKNLLKMELQKYKQKECNQ